MTFAQMGVDAAETARRQAVCARLNVLWAKRERTTDTKKQKSIERSMRAITRAERWWMKDIAFFAY